MKTLFELLKANTTLPPFVLKKGHFVVEETIGTALLVATAFKQNKENYVIVTTNYFNAQQVFEQLITFLDNDDVLLFPADELLRSEALAASKELLAQRLYALNKMQSDHPHVIVTNLAAALRFLPAPKLFNQNKLTLKVGDVYDIEQIKKVLVESGYYRVNKIDQSLQFAIRGDILDIYSVNDQRPTRVEFFDDQIESIRSFDVATQISDEVHDQLIILPASDTLFSDEARSHFEERMLAQMEKDKKHLAEITADQLGANIVEDIERVKGHAYHLSLYKYMGFAEENHFNIFDYCRNATVILNNETQIETSERLLIEESFAYLSELREEGRSISHLELYQSLNKVLSSGKHVIRFNELSSYQDDIHFQARSIIGQATNLKSTMNLIEGYIREGYRILISYLNNNQKTTISESLSSLNLEYELVDELSLPLSNIGLTSFAIDRGFELVKEKIVVLGPRELFAYQGKNTRFLSRFKEATILKSYEDLKPGDYVVHEYRGIGKFIDITTLLVDGIHKDYLHIAYAGTDVLYVPLTQFRLVRKYAGREGAAPRLSSLNSKEWENTKKRIKERINDIADKLIALYAKRANSIGYAYPPDDEIQRQFESEFPFEMTKDQQQSIDEIKRDMEVNEPMDRLLCGDVGFGKTEIAFRAIFKAISSGKQAAFLCPTTLLARQHYEVAIERFAKYGIRVGILSRLVPESIQKAYIESINDGKLNLIIGTHRILSKEIKFKNLGLLVVDEEQRFGVEQKESIKGLKANIDVLTLSATPIPRTLQMSLVGIRQLSQINTPPTDRMPIQTYVMAYKESVIKELIERELGRKGQVFYLHNQVSTIFGVANKLQRMVNAARIGVVHGQMDKEMIEDVMVKFYSGEVNLLVCTSIVENGIDVPNANMIIVESADRFGLSQLYQIKGRVGRGNRMAYAYLLYNDRKVLNDKAKKRLKAIQDFTELGSGYKIAQRDLMIRGAGDMLGAEQAGFIDSVGIDMYIKLLNEAINDKKSGKTDDTPVKPATNLSIEAYIPSAYANKSDKIELYQDIEGATTIEAINRINREVRDVYGRLPVEVENLLRKRKADVITSGPEFEEVIETGDRVIVKLSKKVYEKDGIGTVLFQALVPISRYIKFKFANRELVINLIKDGSWFEHYETLIETINRVYNEYEEQK